MDESSQKLGTLMWTHRAELYNFALSLCRDRTRSQDFVQQAYLQAWKARDRFVLGTSMRSWLFNIIHNLYRMDLRQRTVNRTTEDVDGMFAAKMASLETPLDYLVLQDIWVAWEKLPAGQRQTLELVMLQGYDYAEAAAELRCSPETIKTRVHRARATLKILLDYRPQVRSEVVAEFVAHMLWEDEDVL